MKYLSVCSGIEAATVAWHHMGWEAVGYSEIEKFPSQVLAHHYPNVPNLEDMTKFKEWDIGTVDLLVGGTPCQSFSVAGLRKGLEDPRGNLALTYCAILDRFKPKWFVWENVPGVLSSGGGRDFGSFLGAVAQLGYGFAYRVLDAQYFGVAQRRKRVFVVGCLGSWRSAAEVLFERESLCGDIKKSKVKREDIAATIAARFGVSRNNYEELAPIQSVSISTDIVGALCASDCKGVGNQYVNDNKRVIQSVYENHGTDSRIKPVNVSPTVTSRWGTGGNNVPLVNKTISIQGNLIGRDKGGPQGIGVAENAPMYTLNATDVHGVAQSMAVRRLTPIECERLQGFPDNYTDIKFKGKDTPDGPRYKALGNSMAVPVMRWIGERINNSQ